MLKNKQVMGGVVIAGFLAIVTLAGAGSTGSLFANTASAAYGGGGGGTATKVTVCHNGNTIKVAKSAVSAHTKHGDTVGACAPTPVVLGASTSTVPTDISSLKLQLISLINQLISNLKAQLISAK